MSRVLAVLAASAMLLCFVFATAAADDPGLAGESKQPARDAVVAFLKDVAAGKFDEAYARTTAAYQKAHPKDKWKQGFTKIAGKVDLGKLKLDQMFASEPRSDREARAAGVTNLLDTDVKNRKVGFGFGLVREKDQWLIRDIDALPHLNAVTNFITRFREVEPTAVEVPAFPNEGNNDPPKPAEPPK
jgi:hypothetical protein